MRNNLRERVQTFTATTLSNVRALLDSMQSPAFVDDHAESVEPIAECFATIFDRAATTLREIVMRETVNEADDAP